MIANTKLQVEINSQLVAEVELLKQRLDILEEITAHVLRHANQVNTIMEQHAAVISTLVKDNAMSGDDDEISVH